jgi:hypothetical protein
MATLRRAAAGAARFQWNCSGPTAARMPACLQAGFE